MRTFSALITRVHGGTETVVGVEYIEEDDEGTRKVREVVPAATLSHGDSITITIHEPIEQAALKDPATEVEDLRKAIWYLNREIERPGFVESNVDTAPVPVPNTYTLSPVYTDG